MNLDVLTRLTRTRAAFPIPSDACIGGLHLRHFGANRIDPPHGQDLHRTSSPVHYITWIAAGEALVHEPGPQRVAGAGDMLVLPSYTTHRYASTAVRGWRALAVGFTCDGFDRLALPFGVAQPSPAAARAFADLATQAAAGGHGARLAAGLAALLAELAASIPPRRADAAAETVAAQLREHPLRTWDLPGLARQHGLSWSALRQALRRRTGLSPQRLLRGARLARAASLLATGASVGEAAAAAGFADPFHFSRLFRQAYGVPPRRWRDVAG